MRNRLYLRRTGVQFEKVGRGLLQGGKRREGEWALWVEARGDEKIVRNRLRCVCFYFFCVFNVLIWSNQNYINICMKLAKV